MKSRPASKLVRHGLPFISLTILGWFGLSYAVKGRIDVQDAKRRELDLRAPIEKQRAKKFNIDEELDRLKKESKLDYKNKPIPRPSNY